MKINIKLTSGEVAKIVDGLIFGPTDMPITNISKIEEGKEGDLTFLSRTEYEKFLERCYSSCILVPKGFVGVPKPNQSFVECEDPYLSLVTVIKLVAAANKPNKRPEVHRSAIISPNAKISKLAKVGARCIIGDDCIIADNAELHPNVILYDNVIIGESTEIHSNVVCYSGSIIGKNCIIHAGVVIGADGFGFLEKDDGAYDKIPQLGGVMIGDNVEIGANTTIDRALLDNTVIRDGVKLDNLVHIAHNCDIGENTAMAAQVGISGSTKIGKRNRIGGQAGVAGHIEISDDVILSAKSGVGKSLRDKGIYFGAPAKERTQAFKLEAYIRRLPDIAVDVEVLKKHMLKENANNNENNNIIVTPKDITIKKDINIKEIKDSITNKNINIKEQQTQLENNTKSNDSK
jgi:UDP-3-O-[3-hydroxymyristoyl] glucosamine N-acyltransferase